LEEVDEGLESMRPSAMPRVREKEEFFVWDGVTNEKLDLRSLNKTTESSKAKYVQPDTGIKMMNVDEFSLQVEYNNKKLLKMIKIGVEKDVCDFLKNRLKNLFEINYRNKENGKSYGHYGVKRGSFRILDRLVREGIDLGSRSNKGETALELAVKKNLPEMVRHLVKRGAKYCDVDSDGRSVIHYCVMFDRAEILEFFLEKPEFCSNCEQCNLPDVHNMGPLDYARDNEKLLGLLKSHGAKEKHIACETERSARQVTVKNLLQKEKDKKFNQLDFGPDGGSKTRTDLHHTDFSVHQMIGKGSFGEVYLVEYKETKE
jgi:hypothetical protein